MLKKYSKRRAAAATKTAIKEANKAGVTRSRFSKMSVGLAKRGGRYQLAREFSRRAAGERKPVKIGKGKGKGRGWHGDSAGHSAARKKG
jgi:hypothetical protein